MRRRALLRAFCLGPIAALPLERPIAPLDPPLDPRPLSADNPRIWPAVTRDQPLPMGAVEAYVAPERAAEMGVQWQRIMLDWSALQPHSPDDWSFVAGLQRIARHERDAGRPMIGVLMSTPSWASGTSDPKSPPLGLDLALDDVDNVWASWVRSLVSRFAEVIDTWVMWNEPDVWFDDGLNHARQWTGTLEQYYQLLRVGYLVAKAANPAARVLLAGLTYWWDAAYGRDQYFERLLRLMSADATARANNFYFDAAVLQLYNNPRGLFDAPRVFHELMREYGILAVPSKPVWVNETNVVPWDDSAAPLTRAHFRATQDEQANFLVQAVAYALASDVARLAVFKMVDDAQLAKNVEQAFGMVRADETHSVRPIFRAYQMLRREMTPTSRAQLVDEGLVNRVYLEQRGLGRRMTVLWNRGPTPRPARVAALGTSALRMDRFGATSELSVTNDGHIDVTLAPATANTVPGHPDTYFIGGEPAIIVEPLPDNYEPFAPTYENLPEPGQQ